MTSLDHLCLLQRFWHRFKAVEKCPILDQMSEKESPSRSRGRRISEAEIDMRSHDEQVEALETKAVWSIRMRRRPMRSPRRYCARKKSSNLIDDVKGKSGNGLLFEKGNPSPHLHPPALRQCKAVVPWANRGTLRGTL